MRYLTILCLFGALGSLAAVDAPAPTIPDLSEASIGPLTMPGYLSLYRDQGKRGTQTVLLPLHRLASIDLKNQPVGTTMKESLVLTFAYEQPLVLTFAQGRTALEPQVVLAALRQAGSP